MRKAAPSQPFRIPFVRSKFRSAFAARAGCPRPNAVCIPPGLAGSFTILTMNKGPGKEIGRTMNSPARRIQAVIQRVL